MAGEPPIPNVAEVEETTLEAAVNIQLAPPQPQLQSPQPVPRPPPTPAKVNDGDHMSVLAGHAEYVREIMDIEDELSMIHWALSQHKWVIENWTKPKPSLFAYSHSLVQAFDDDNDDAEDRDAREYYKRIERIRVGRYGKEPSNTFGSGAGYGGRIKHFESPWVSRVEDLQRRTRMVEKSVGWSITPAITLLPYHTC